RFDALAFADQPDASSARVIILDWKTYRHRPSRRWLATQLQSRVYPVVLLRAGAALMASSSPSDVELWYWFAEHPTNPERLPYSEAAYRADVA
ncbi:MAG: PD-(D/E)XK nuclease family protein, partial [Anaerolineae bacterium]|nr:PD-(D/E)XK nuclease family protein [Anaerolineae bacterium]